MFTLAPVPVMQSKDFPEGNSLFDLTETILPEGGVYFSLTSQRTSLLSLT